MLREQQLEQVMDWAGHRVSSSQLGQLDRVAQWLATEGRDAGGIGPDEAVWERHILDSLMFSKGFTVPPSSLVDLGGGIGLPGLPLAVLFPTSAITLVDRSTRRMRLVRRVCRIVGIENLTTMVGDIEAITANSFSGGVMRAVLPPDTGIPLLREITKPDGVAVFGVGLDMFHVKHQDGETTRFPGSEVLDPGRWIHIIQPL